ncbi:hypothetical protein [Hymenobacter properus]|uniref:DUF932 domain-containing protein n=1 Tax=Hymenobacter properus TaxID=2791026 RepID=A0A931BL95_9BACT|nr:hypothetical protein [Hymenobacter properus]MBF9144377.1 hypothetical protein [Hymenobacter properus]MBR7723195.1 hypothetical protein [Microvirga sp. SRT04]
MSQQSITLDRTTQWEPICFPVETKPLIELLPEGYALLPSDRRLAIIGEMSPGHKSIFALQSAEYSLVPNELLRRVADEHFAGHKLDVRYTAQGEFSITLILPTEIAIQSANGPADILSHSLIINNSYSGKTPLTLQGTALKEYRQEHTELKMRVSYYRRICSNGLMGWADDYLNMDDYLTWLANGKPKKHKDARRVEERGLTEVTRREGEQEVEVLMQKKFTHKGLSLEWFEQHLAEIFQAFKRQQGSLTAQVYQQLAHQAAPIDREKLLAETGLPKMLARTALERLQKEERELETPANLWLAYNAVNYALFNSRSSLTINDRYRLDEAAFHQMATLAVS